MPVTENLRLTEARADCDGTLRAALRAFATGVTVVTSAGPGLAPCGVTANAFSSVSLDPPLVLVCLRSSSSAAATIAAHRVFAVNVLSASQEWLARRFSSAGRPRGAATFREVDHRLGVTGAPLLGGAAAWLDCRLFAVHGAGDHVIVIGEVTDFGGSSSVPPLLFHAGRYRSVSDARRSGPDRRFISTASERR